MGKPNSSQTYKILRDALPSVPPHELAEATAKLWAALIGRQKPSLGATSAPAQKDIREKRAKDIRQERAKAGKKGGRARAERQRLVLELGPAEILEALNTLYQMRRAGQNPRQPEHAWRLNQALGRKSPFTVPKRQSLLVNTPELHEVLWPLVWALDEMTSWIGPKGLATNADSAGFRLAARLKEIDENIDRHFLRIANPNNSLLGGHAVDAATAARRAAAERVRSPANAASVLFQCNLKAASALVSQMVGAPLIWRAHVYRCARFPRRCRGTPFCLRASNNPETRLCPRCGGQGKRADTRRLKHSK